MIVERKKGTFSITTKTDSITKTVEVKNGFSSAFWLGNLFSGAGIIGYGVDLTNSKRFTYPNKIYINTTDSLTKYHTFDPNDDNKGELYLHLSLPHFNFFHLAPEGEKNTNGASFWGLTAGLDYYHRKNQFINLGGTYAVGLAFPIPAAIDLSGEYEFMSSWYVSLSNNHKFERFKVGYGLSFGKYFWDFKYFDWGNPEPPTREPVSKSHYALGLVFPAYYQLGKHFNFGVVYRPTFYRPTLTNKFVYEHLISIDFVWKIRIKK